MSQGALSRFEEEYSVIDKAKGRRALSGLAALLAILLAAALVSSCGNARAKVKTKSYPVAGVVVEAPGHFDTWPEGRDCWIPGAPGAAILYGDTVKNGTGGGLVLLLSSGGTVRAGEMSDFKVSKGTKGTPVVDVERGEVWVDGSSSTEVLAPSTKVTSSGAKVKSDNRVAGVKVVPAGTTTVVAARGAESVVSYGTSVTLKEGMECVCEQGKPLQPVKTSAVAPAGGLAYIIGLQSTPYFRNEATRSKAEDEARAKLAIDPNDAWSNVNLGRALLDAGKTADAEASFTHALDINKGFSQAFAGLGRAALVEGRWGQAAKLYEQARMADRSSPEALIGAANSALGLGDMREAQKWYKAALDNDSQNQLALSGLGAASLLTGDLTEATDNLEKSVRAEPSNVPALVLLSLTSALKGNLEPSATYLKRAADVKADDLGVRSTLADRYLRMDMAEDARVAFKRLTESDDRGMMSAGFQGMGAVAQHAGNLKDVLVDWAKAQDLMPDRTALLEDLGEAHLLVGQTDAAVTTLARATVVDINDWRAHEMLARADLAGGMNAGAVSEGQAAVKLAPDQWSAHLVLGLALEASGARDDAARQFDIALNLKPDGKFSAAEHALLADSLSREGKTDEALAEYRAAQSINPSEGAYYRLAGDMLLELNRTADAIAQYRKAVEVDSKDSLANVKLAAALYKSGKKTEAVGVLQRAVRKDPNDPTPRQLLGQYLLADNDVDGALFQLDAAASMQGIQPSLLASVLVTRGNAKDRKEDFAGAMADYARAISTDPGRGDAWFYLAGDLERTGKTPDARTAYSNAATLCKDKADWKKFYDESIAKVNQLH